MPSTPDRDKDEDAIRVTGATYVRLNDNEKIIHAIRKMIEEKKVAADA